MRAKEIAQLLGSSAATVQGQIANIHRVMGVRSTLELMAKVYGIGLCKLPGDPEDGVPEVPIRSPLSDRMASDLWSQLGAANMFEDEACITKISTFLFTNLLTRARLGNATTEELLDEVKARVDLKYKTVGCDDTANESPSSR